MKKIAVYFIVGLAVAFTGILFSDIFADIFNGLPNGTGAVVGMIAYLCVIVITCTGIIAAKLDNKSSAENGEEKK